MTSIKNSTTLLTGALLTTFRDVGKQCHLARAFDRDRDLTLMAAARARNPAGADLAALGDVPAQLIDVLVVDLVDLVLAEEAGLPSDRARGLARALAAVLRLPFTPIEAAVDAHGAALGEVLRATLALVAPDRDVEVVGLVAPVSLRVLLARVDGDPQLADGRAAGGVPQLGILRQI